MNLSFDRTLADGYRSHAQIARVLTQDWVERELYCPACLAADLEPTPQNTRSRDFNCRSCSEPYELKSRAGPFRSRVLDGDYHAMLATIQESRTPSLLLLEYDREALAVRNLSAVHRNLVSESSVVPRKSALSHAARRRGWLGCYIDLFHIPPTGRIRLVEEGVPLPSESVQAGWRTFEFTEHLTPRRRGWLVDVLTCVERLPEATFSLREVYGFEEELRALHPMNRNIQPKIRQQLQVLVRTGLVERVEPGSYRRVNQSPGLAPM